MWRGARPDGLRRVRARGDSGQEMAVEVMVLLPVVLVLVVLVVWTGRYTTSRSRLADVAGAAARAASLEADERAGRAAAQRTIDGATLPEGCSELTPDVRVVGPREHPASWRGASVTVRLTCTVRNTALAGVWAPGAVALRGRATHPVDPFRAP